MPPKGGASKPTLLFCYLCGNQFGSTSLGIHIPQCYEKKMKVWNNGDPKERGAKPKHPDEVDLSGAGTMTKEEFNNQQYGEFTDNLSQCENCGRKFLPDRLVVHLKSCNPMNSGGGSKAVAGKGPPSSQGKRPPSNSGHHLAKGPAAKPSFLVCYLCGQQFGTSSLGIHVPQCYEKKMKVWTAGDPKERGPKPKHPDEVDLSGAGTMTKEEFNNQQFGEFTENLAQCENCGRKFLPDRLLVHQRSCKPGASGGGSKGVAGKAPPSSQGSRAPSSNGSSSGHHLSKGPAAKPTFLVCYLCGNQFGTSSLGIHIPQCYEKKMKVWNNGDPEQRGPKPKNPNEVDLTGAGTLSKEEFNNQQFGEFTENLAQCENCGRKFLPDRLVVHQKSCKPGASGGGSKAVTGKAPPSSQGSRAPSSNGRPPSSQGGSSGGGGGSSSSPAKGKGPAFRPQLLLCYLCGQQFGTASLKIHIPQCYDKKIKVWENTDSGERGPKPKHPDEVSTSSAGTMSNEEFNNQQMSTFTDNMAQCNLCGRKFLPDRLVVHQRSCRPGASGGGSKPVAQRAVAQQGGSGGGGASTASPPPSKPVPSPSAGRNPLNKFDPQQRHNNAPPPGATGSTMKPLPPKLRALQRVLFEEGDANHDGHIDIDELTALATDVDPTVSTEEINNMMSQLDLNGDGVIDADEWARWASGSGSAGGGGGGKPPPASSGGGGARKNPLKKVAQGADQGRVCSSCQAVEYEASAKFCKDCGTAYPKGPPRVEEQGPSKCRACKFDLDEGAKFCSNCGMSTTMPITDPPVEDEEAESGGGGGDALVIGKSCPNCGYGNEEHETQCAQCECELEDDYGEQEEEEDRHAQQHTPSPPPAGAGASGGGGGKGWNRTQSKPAHHDDIEEENGEFPQQDSGPDDRIECSNCGRKFAAESIQKHESICNKSKKRRVFDQAKMRAKGSDIGEFGPVKGHASAANAPKPKNTWKDKSADFRNAMKASRALDEAKKNGGPLPEPTYSENSHYTPCPYCGRKFAPETAERHIPKCKNTVNKPKPPPKRRK